MIRLTLFSVLVIALVACSSRDEGSVTPTVPSQVTPAPAVITVGEPLRGTYLSAQLTYQLTPPSTGTLVLTLSWDPNWDGARLMLTVADTSFMASPPNWSPVVARVPVSKGQTYLVKVDEGVDVWDPESDPFELIASIE